MLDKIITAGLIIVVGLIFIGPWKTIIAKLTTVMNDTVPMTPFFEMIWSALPLLALVAIFVHAVFVFRQEDSNGPER